MNRFDSKDTSSFSLASQESRAAFATFRESSSTLFDITIIGAGIVGLATAYKLLKDNPALKICVIEKEKTIAQHQTGHNSGVIHSGIYYKPGSLKAINCQKGYYELIEFAKEHGIKHDICGKVIVATNPKELPALENIYQRGVANGLAGIRKISAAEVKEIEPYVNSVEGIWVPQTGIIDYKDVAQKYLELILLAGATVLFENKVIQITEQSKQILVATNQQEITTRKVVNCAGLYSDKVTKLSAPNTDIQILPFRGEYFELVKNREYLVKNLIYPVPNPNFPFLGVHFTRMAHGGIEAGPNAVLAYKREGYTRWQVDGKELWETLSHPGFQKVAAKYWQDGLGELYRSYSKAAFVKALQHLIPSIKSEDLVEGNAGVRAQACDSKGNLIDDFMLIEQGNILNVCNAPSPAATASLAIGTEIAKRISQ
jgi:(S)-2-hydroxyglutarate dehydrogenase